MALPIANEPQRLRGEVTGGRGRLLLQGRHLQLVWPGMASQEGVAWRTRRAEEHGKGPEPPPHANMVSCSHLNKSKVTTPSRSVSRVLKNRNMVSSRTRQHTKLSKSTARSGSE